MTKVKNRMLLKACASRSFFVPYFLKKQTKIVDNVSNFSYNIIRK